MAATDDTLGDEAEARIAELERVNRDLSRALAERELELAAAEERAETLEIQLESAIKELALTKTSLRGVHNRALAVSRISEVRVELQELEDSKDGEVLRRLEMAGQLLQAADQALEEENFGGAAFLAEQASELVRQAVIVRKERQSAQSGEIIPVVPPRRMEVLSRANLRVGPLIEAERVALAEPGDEVVAVARAGDWYRVRTEAGVEAWIHRRLVRPF